MRNNLWMRDQRGIALPSPVVLLSIVAVAMALVAFVVTRGNGQGDEKVIPAAAVSTAPTTGASTATPTTTAPTAPKTHKPAPVKRAKVYVEVFNNSQVKGLAATVGDKAAKAGWNVVGADNWYGSIPATTVYYPARLKAAAKQLALDLGVHRTAPAVDPMKMDRLTLILTAPLG
jgi:hypothetical protein